MWSDFFDGATGAFSFILKSGDPGGFMRVGDDCGYADFAVHGQRQDGGVADADGIDSRCRADNPLLAEFSRLHSVSVSLESVVLLAGIAAMFLLVREVGRLA